MRRSGFLLLFFLISIWGMSQELTVTGKVTDVAQDPVVGATIVVKGTTMGTVTNLDGEYSLKVDNPNAALVFSFVGMKTQEIQLNGKNKLSVELEEQTTGLDEVVVVGYGAQKKESIVAAISTISADEIVQSPAANLTTGLAGKMPGLTIMIKDGELGKENVDTYIRGQATLNGSNPLILVDGIEREISTLDPYDIESVSILKDASATAVFGVRGANGVILITSKKGVVGAPEVSVNMNYSLQSPTRLPKPLRAIDYMNTRNSVIEQHNAFTGGETPLPYPEETINKYRTGYLPEYYVDRDWIGEFMHDYVPMYKGNVNIRGGSKKTKYFASVGYMRQGGPFKTERWDEYNYDNEQRLDRFTYRANIDMQITPTLRGWLNLSGYLQDKNDPIIFGADATSATTASFYYLQLASYLDKIALGHPDLTPDGRFVVGGLGGDRTPYGNLNRSGYRVTTNNTVNSTVGLEQDLKFITKGLSARAMVAYDARATHVRGFRRTYQVYAAQLETDENGEEYVVYVPGESEATELTSALTQSFRTNFDLEASLNYKRNFGSHDVTGLLLYKQNQRIVNADVPFNYVGIVGRAVYGYNNRYLAEFNFGMNGSEQFAKGRRFGFFPSISLGWVVSEENFIPEGGALEFLKIRGSLGQVGNDNISNNRFIYLGDWTQNGGNYFAGMGAVPGLGNAVYERSIANELVSWEVSNQYNIGIESRFRGGFEFDLDMFYENRSSILIDELPIPKYMFGQLNLPPRNDGEMENKGFEATLGYSISINEDLYVSTRLSASYARNKVLNANESPLDETYAYQYRIEGFSRGTRWGYDCLGYFADQEDVDSHADQTQLGAEVMPGDLKYRDVNNDGEINDKDHVPMDSPGVPEWNFTMTSSIAYKGFDLSVLLHTVGNYSFDFSGRGIYDWHGNGIEKNYFELHKYAWTEEKAQNNGDIRYPRMHPDGVSVSKQPSNYWIINLWYMRIKNLELGYTLPKDVTSTVGLGKARVYFNGLNLATFDNMPFKYLDPEVSNSLSHPIFATYNFGLNVTF